MKKYKLKDSHPTKRKVDEIFELCQKLGINFRYTRAGYMMVDDSHRNESFYLEDVDSSLPCQTIPHPIEFKLTYDEDTNSL